MAFLFLLGFLLSDQPDQADAPTPPTSYWIVISPQTKLMAGDSPKGTLPPGTLLRCTKTHGGWRFSVEYRGWVHTNDLVALDKAVEFFTQIIAQKPTAAAFHHRGIAHAALENWGDASRDFQEAARRGDQSVELLINLGNAQRHLGQGPLAIESYTQAIKQNPLATFAFLHRGSLLAEQGHWDASLKDLLQAAELAPESSEVQNHLGVTLRMLGRYEDAIVAYSKAIEIVPQHALALANRGYALKNLGRYQEALADYESALEIEPNSVEIKNDLAWLLATCPEPELRQPERALSLAKAVLEADKQRDPDHLDTLAAAHASLEQFAEAEQLLDEALRLLSGKPGADALAARLELYRERKPYFEPAVTTP